MGKRRLLGKLFLVLVLAGAAVVVAPTVFFESLPDGTLAQQSDVKVPVVRNAKGFSKDLFAIDTEAGAVRCPAGHVAGIIPFARRGSRIVSPLLRELSACHRLHQCTTWPRGEHRSARGCVASRQEAPARSGVATDLSGDAPNRRTKDRALRTQTLGRR